MQKSVKSPISWLGAALVSLFVISELVLAFMIQLVPYSDFGKVAYLSIILVFAFSFFNLASLPKNVWLIRLGLLFTLIADFFLVVLVPERAIEGVSVFIFAQLAYGVYLYTLDGSTSKKYVSLIIRVVLSLVALIIPPIVLGEGIDALSVISMLYYAQLVSNLIIALIYKRPLFAIALFLFALCDLSIGIDNLVNSYIGASEGSFFYLLANTKINLAWVFYLPSQVLIAVYAAFNKK